MKKYFFLLFALFTFSAFGQVVYLGGYTQSQINGITPGSGYPLLFNETSQEFQRYNGSAWEEFVAWNNLVNANIIPDGDLTRGLGNGSNRFASVYTGKVIYGSQTSDPTFATNWGQTYYRSDLNRLSYWDGTKIQRIANLEDTSKVLPAKDTLLTSANDELTLNYTHFQSGADAGRRKLLRKNNGRIDLTPSAESIPINTVWRARTGADNDTVAVNPANGYELVFEGTNTGNAGYITGPYSSMYIEKVGNDTLLISGTNLVQYNFSSDFVQSLNPAFYFKPDGIGATSWDDTSGSYSITTAGTTPLTFTAGGNMQSAGNSTSWGAMTTNPAINIAPGSEDITIIIKIGVINSISGYLISKATGTLADRGFAIDVGADKIDFLYAGGVEVTPAANTLADGALIIVTYSGTNANMWVDGTQIVTNQTIGTGTGDSSPWTFAARDQGSAALAGGPTEFEMVALIKGTAVNAQQRADIEAQWQTN